MRSLRAAAGKPLLAAPRETEHAATKTKGGKKETEHSKHGWRKSLAWLRKD